jgi:hypothetical protein
MTLQRTDRIVAEARSRLAGLMPESSSRLVSLHDTDVRPIRKGRSGVHHCQGRTDVARGHDPWVARPPPTRNRSSD